MKRFSVHTRFSVGEIGCTEFPEVRSDKSKSCRPGGSLPKIQTSQYGQGLGLGINLEFYSTDAPIERMPVLFNRRTGIRSLLSSLRECFACQLQELESLDT
jgi:hypothetical protein